MRSIVESIDLTFGPDASTASRGLVEIQMKKIGGLAILAGANGSGKSRTLQLVRDAVEQNQGRQAAGMEQVIAGVKLSKAGSFGSIIDVFSIPQALPAVNGVQSASPDDLIAARQLINSDATNYSVNLNQSLRWAQSVLTDFLATGNVLLHDLSQDDKSLRRKKWENLKSILEPIVGGMLSYDNDGILLIDGRPRDEGYALLSDGQKKLFCIASTTMGKASDRGSQIIMFDEPETHLHPQAAIQLIKLLQDVLENGQLWIATHSVPLIAGLGIEHVWYAEKGKISYGGNKAERVINGLIGGHDNLTSLREVLAEPDKIATARFASECLTSPEVVTEVRPDDPQFRQIEGTLAQVALERRVQVLDWGAGRGRLKVWLSQRQITSTEIDYLGYEKSPKAAEECRKHILRATGSDEQAIVSSVDAVRARSAEIGGFDFVILSNVLHEIDAPSWLPLFHQIGSVLHKRGCLLVLEDTLLPIGELPNDNGFLLVDQVSCSKLVRQQVQRLASTQAGYEDRLECFVLTKEQLTAVSLASIRDCINSIRRTSLEEISRTRLIIADRSISTDYKTGHRHALSLVQFANATLALASLSTDLEDTSI